MFKSSLKAALIAGAAFAVSAAHAGAWTLDSASSKIAFGSVKNEELGEVHSFNALKGNVAPSGAVSIEIDLASVETNIDIRNERMIKYVFGDYAKAMLNAQIDMAKLSALAVGETTTLDVDGALSFLGAEEEIETQLFVARLSETRVLATTSDMIFVAVDDYGMTSGIDKLMEIAGLDGITRASPVTVRFLFNNDQKQAAKGASTQGESSYN